VELDYTVLSAF